ncbi:enoyl-CoA hydratase/isomerase family protein [Pengzhenrongella frigida]|uniref:Enoyl-CoA hydratase/isomerase family protein n=1 Tax=Pengzhenrongella frigida TaxID=1259133 RepID=A0A4Q5N2B8_9MICO|nr:enoyl-CoA hydratase/isomerase family protein [Cellulomonas sp. HLT2-17]RYV52322.1 enoyl-CoA hydratase/isomerase family protein [Cellulomonas sp. HLT2-17]
MLTTIAHGPVLELRLSRPPVNALDPALVAAIREGIRVAVDGGARAVVLSGVPGIFSAGLDVPVLLGLDRAEMVAFWRGYVDLLAALGRCPVPVVAAVTGHSPAGGAVLALFCDYRVMARGDFRIGLNEVQVGLAVPELVQFALRRLVGPHRAERLMVAGAMVDPDEALRVGLVDELADVEHVVGRALAWCRAHLDLPPAAMAQTRRIARADLATVLAAAVDDESTEFLDRWFSDETQATLTALVDALRSRSLT